MYLCWKWVTMGLIFFLLKLMNSPHLHWAQGAWQAVAEYQKPLLIQTGCTISLLRCFVPKRRPWDSVGAQQFAVVSCVSAGQNVSRMWTCTQNTLLQPFVSKFCLKTLWSPWIFCPHYQESILHLHFCTGAYIIKTVHVPLIACMFYGPDQKPHKNDHWILYFWWA